MMAVIDEGSWLDLQPDQKPAAPLEPVRFGLMKMRKAPARGVVLLRREIVDLLRMETHRVDIRLGQGANTHQLAILPNPQGLFELLEVVTGKGGGTWRVRLPRVERWPDVAYSSVGVKYEIRELGKRSMLVINLPPAFWDSGSRAALLRRPAVAAKG